MMQKYEFQLRSHFISFKQMFLDGSYKAQN